MPLLKNLVDDEFIPFDEKRFNKQLRRTDVSIIIASLAIIIPIIFEKCSSNNITTNDAKEIVSAIKELKTTETDNPTPQLFDTLEIKVLTPHTPIVKEKANTSLPQQDTSTQIK